MGAHVPSPIGTNYQALNPAIQWPQVILFKDDNFAGDQVGPIYMAVSALTANNPINPNLFWPETSSIIIIAGTWQFFRRPDFQGPPLTLGPGRYPSVSAAANDPAWNDAILSLRYITVA